MREEARERSMSLTPSAESLSFEELARRHARQADRVLNQIARRKGIEADTPSQLAGLAAEDAERLLRALHEMSIDEKKDLHVVEVLERIFPGQKITGKDLWAALDERKKESHGRFRDLNQKVGKKLDRLMLEGKALGDQKKAIDSLAMALMEFCERGDAKELGHRIEDFRGTYPEVYEAVVQSHESISDFFITCLRETELEEYITPELENKLIVF